MTTQKIGKIGERIAGDYLTAKNYLVLAQNYYSRYGEIDLITIDLSRDELVFVEVKTRSSDKFGAPQDSVTYAKRQKLLKTALHFLNSTSQKLPSTWRIDVIALELTGEYRLKNINHFKNIFDG